ncbi:acetyltransferase [Clostridium pasteurianum DSM 525 = ATCC 6013]|uniref:Acetyltransferase n=1 Tax=Clostridium pasteurianum DSM 525 = ATCC 6013 TaxID=1262449 RepID=A0A0H3J7U5_CLOPA|nr:GNAT family N-acetyltransferase [Clostridium pasteurianum]AJA47075.1 acetyltransferase [Clostridium pasteurianum DSM 525 = ATCC 6013]AJA51063.1 acetyltransferase [Clostridium pasteurianum DSM 525 = ATCC 6013]AOZ74438.1 acetyltransferase [Clostridium pasteurianum DSM 525 = ATCC 6013]AOZ78235.1 acetyltransferase [Clostridium pasteurianum]ELP59538.1 acetyltransferase [Clostridium pasteurianum DSM 525 = ATCC 6013]
MVQLKEGVLTAEYFNILSDSVGWGYVPVNQLKKAIENSLYTVCAFDNNNIIAMGRLCGDDSLFYYIKDVAVLPKYQHKGIGNLILKNMLSFIKQRTPKDWKVSVELISSKNKEGFYKKFGFELRPSEYDGAGMFLMIKDD